MERVPGRSCPIVADQANLLRETTRRVAKHISDADEHLLSVLIGWEMLLFLAGQHLSDKGLFPRRGRPRKGVETALRVFTRSLAGIETTSAALGLSPASRCGLGIRDAGVIGDLSQLSDDELIARRDAALVTVERAKAEREKIRKFQGGEVT